MFLQILKKKSLKCEKLFAIKKPMCAKKEEENHCLVFSLISEGGKRDFFGWIVLIKGIIIYFLCL